MADNYLEKRFDEVFGSGKKTKKVVVRNNPSLETLLHRSLPAMEFAKGTTETNLREIASVSVLSETFGNNEAFHMDIDAEAIPAKITIKDIANPMHLGAILQSMILKATSLGLAHAVITDNASEAVLLIGTRARSAFETIAQGTPYIKENIEYYPRQDIGEVLK